LDSLTDKQRRSIKGTINEFFNIKDKDEVCECVKEMELSSKACWIEKFALVVIETSPKDSMKRDMLAEVVGYLKSKSVVSDKDVKTGLDNVREFIPDIAIDVPLAPKYFKAFEEACTK
jgi:translation initiation factor 4G